MISAFICAIVLPLPNTATWTTPRGQFTATYRDNGDQIQYSRPVPRIVRVLVEQRTGTTPRVACRRAPDENRPR